VSRDLQEQLLALETQFEQFAQTQTHRLHDAHQVRVSVSVSVCVCVREYVSVYMRASTHSRFTYYSLALTLIYIHTHALPHSSTHSLTGASEHGLHTQRHYRSPQERESAVRAARGAARAGGTAGMYVCVCVCVCVVG
jgi:hypothetical protein